MLSITTVLIAARALPKRASLCGMHDWRSALMLRIAKRAAPGKSTATEAA